MELVKDDDWVAPRLPDAKTDTPAEQVIDGDTDSTRDVPLRVMADFHDTGTIAVDLLADSYEDPGLSDSYLIDRAEHEAHADGNEAEHDFGDDE